MVGSIASGKINRAQKSISLQNDDVFECGNDGEKGDEDRVEADANGFNSVCAWLQNSCVNLEWHPLVQDMTVGVRKIHIFITSGPFTGQQWQLFQH